MFVVTVVFEIEREEAVSFLSRVQQQASDSLEKEPGCQRFDVSVSTKQAECVFLYEIYDDADAFAAHIASDHFSAFDKETSPMTRSKEVRYWTLC